jgi:hypothetical protein
VAAKPPRGSHSTGERAVTAILELAAYHGDPDVVYQASEHVDEG